MIFTDIDTITQQELKVLLKYNCDTGEFHWRMTGKGKPWHMRAGTVNNHGYLVIMIDHKRYLAHRLAWLYVYGVWPIQELDHIDRDPTNNCVSNLRECTHAENHRNTTMRSDNTSGCPGVCWDKQKLKWKVQISIKGQKRHQKHFENMNTAVAYYKLKAQELFGTFAPETVKSA